MSPGDDRISDHVAHELRNSLTALRLEVEVAAIGVDDAAVLESLARINARVDRFEATVAGLATGPDDVAADVRRRFGWWRQVLREAVTDSTGE